MEKTARTERVRFMETAGLFIYADFFTVNLSHLNFYN